MPAIYQHRLKVSSDAIDQQGHVNNLEYLRWLQDAAVAHSTAQGWSPDRYRQLGAGWVVRTHWIEYLQPAFAHDEVLVLTWVANFRKVRSLRKYKIVRVNDQIELARAESDWAFISLECRSPRRIPAELVQAFPVVPDGHAP
jgi:acyl-CoA thioester hydrolase